MASSIMALPWAPSLSPATDSPPRWSGTPAASSSPPSWRRSPTAATLPRTASNWPPSWSLAAANWRTDSPPPPPPAPQCILGRVVKLPEKSEVPATSCAYEKLDLHGQPWNHPVVITGISQDPSGEQLVKFRPCTSFGGQGLAAKKQHHRQYFVKADQIILDWGSFTKQTAVNCFPGHEYTIEFKHLQLWTGEPQFSQAALVSFNKNEPIVPGPRPRRDSVISNCWVSRALVLSCPESLNSMYAVGHSPHVLLFLLTLATTLDHHLSKVVRQLQTVYQGSAPFSSPLIPLERCPSSASAFRRQSVEIPSAIRQNTSGNATKSTSTKLQCWQNCSSLSTRGWLFVLGQPAGKAKISTRFGAGRTVF